MAHIDILVIGYVLGLFLFALNGILWMALHHKYAELKVSEERIIRLLLRARLRRK